MNLHFSRFLLLSFFLSVLSWTANATSNNQQLFEEYSAVMARYHYHPAELQGTAYLNLQRQLAILSSKPINTTEFIGEFNQLWQKGPFSHVRMEKSQRSAKELADFVDTMNVGGQGCKLSWHNDSAILSINTMMGQDTIAQINQAFVEITQAKVKRLIIDLRANNGGAFAVKPLVAHLIDKPLDAGAFIANLWYQENNSVPTISQIQRYEPWQGWSLKAFWHNVQNSSLTRIQFIPQTPLFNGKVFVLISEHTASAAELAADALANLPNVTLVGETTAGQMLSQKMFDLSPGIQLYLPIADYISVRSGRIEGKGVAPKILIVADLAMDKALNL